MLFILVAIVAALVFCRNSMFELVVDCMRLLGLKNKVGGSRGGAALPELGGRSPPHLQTYSLSRQEKALKSECGVLIVARTTIIQ